MGFARKFRRKRLNAAKKQFMKDFKESMKKFKMQVRCSVCNRAPFQGEKIDNWQVNKYSENIDLICTECYSDVESEKDDAKTETSA